MRVYSYIPLDEVDYHPRGDGYADIRLRKDMSTITREADGISTVEYSAEELYFVADLTKKYISDNFAEIWQEQQRAQMTIEERMKELETANTDLEMALCDIYEQTLSLGGE